MSVSEEEIQRIVKPCIGDTWRSRDKRDDGLTVRVLDVEPDRVRIKRFNKTWVRLDRFRRDYEFVRRADA